MSNVFKKKNMKTKLFLLTIIFLTTNAFSQNQTYEPKYIFLFIGDGMGMNHIALTQAYLAEKEGIIGFKALNLTQLPFFGMATTYTKTRLITCSAAAGTALSTGQKTSPSTIAMSYDHKDTLYSITKDLKKLGYKIGILSSAPINDATPAVFYAHSEKRSSLYNIATQVIDSPIDLLGFSTFGSPTNNGIDLSIYTLLEKNGFTVSNNYEQIKTLTSKNLPAHIYAPDCLEDGSVPYIVDRKNNVPTLADFTRIAINLLDNPKGFFLMVEGGKIDWAAHNNDAFAVINEVIDFDNAIGVALEFYKKHPDNTLIVVTADHETGGLSLGNKTMGYEVNFSSLALQKGSLELFSDTLSKIIKNTPAEKIKFSNILELGCWFFGFDSSKISKKDLAQLEKKWEEYQEELSNQKSKTSKYNENPLAKSFLQLKNKYAGVGFTSESHTAAPVPVFAIGYKANIFAGFYDNTDIPKKILQILSSKRNKK